MVLPEVPPPLLFHAHLPWPLLLLSVAAAAVAAAWWAYPRTAGRGRRGIRVLLAALRSSAAVLLVLILAGFEVTLSREVSRAPRLGILVDTSRSMDTPPARAQMDTLARLLPTAIPTGYEVQVRRFDADHAAAALPSVFTLEPTGSRSDAGPALQAMARRHPVPDRVLMVTDAHWTGPPPRPPAEGVPVDVILIGPRREPEGVRIVRVQSPGRVWPGERSGMDVTLASSGLEGRTVGVELVREGRVVSDTTLVLGGSGVRRTFSLPFTLSRPGTAVFTVRLRGPGGEQERAAVVETETARRRITLLAGRPTPAAGAILRALEADPRLQVARSIQLRPDSWDPPPVPAAADSTNAYVVVGTPPGDLPERVRESLVRRVVSGAAGLLLFGPGPAPRAWAQSGVAEALPLRLEAASRLAGPWPVRQEPTGAAGPGIIPSGLPPLPPVEQLVTSGSREDARVLLQGVREGRRMPLLALMLGRYRAAMLMCEGAWRWEQLVRGSGGDPGPVRRMWQDLVHVLATGRSSFLQAGPLRNVWEAGEPIEMEARLRDAGDRPLADAEVRARLVLPAGEGAAEMPMDPVPGVPGLYRGSFRPQPAGAYDWVVRAGEGGAERGTAAGRLAVDPWDPEEHTGGVDRRRAEVLARASGGRVLYPRTAGPVLAGLEAEPVRETVRQRVGTWPSPWALLLAILLLALEWTIRRRYGMM